MYLSVFRKAIDFFLWWFYIQPLCSRCPLSLRVLFYRIYRVSYVWTNIICKYWYLASCFPIYMSFIFISLLMERCQLEYNEWPWTQLSNILLKMSASMLTMEVSLWFFFHHLAFICLGRLCNTDFINNVWKCLS